MQTQFDVYHSKDFESFTLIESSKFASQSAFLESDATIIDTFVIEHEKNDDSVFDMARTQYNQSINKFYSKTSTRNTP